jgi:uncharacterized protein (DUF433 family)
MRWIVADAEHVGGRPRVAGTSVPLQEIIESLAAGLTIADILKKFPVLSREAVQGALRELARWDGIATPPV